MSNKATNWAQAQHVGHSGAKFVLLVLADYADQDWSCFPSVKVISQITEMGESSVRKALALLTSNGLIRSFVRRRDDGSQRSSRYQLLPDGDGTPEPEVCDWSHQRSTREPPLSEGAPPPLPQRGGPLSEGALIPYIDPSPVDPSPLTPGASRTAKATRLPDDFQPTEEMRNWFVAENLHNAIPDPRTEHATFCDYWRAKAGAGARKVDWPATWRNWMRRAANDVNRSTYRNATVAACKPSTTDQRIAQGQALAAKYREQGL